MELDKKESCLPTETDHLRHRAKPDFLTERSSSNHVPLFNILYGALKPSYCKIREVLDAVVSLTVTWLGPDGLICKLFLSSRMLKQKGVNTGYGIFVKPEIMLTTSYLFELPVGFRLDAVFYNNEECDLIDMPEYLPSTAPEMRRLRYLRTKYPRPHIDEVGYGFPLKRDVSPLLSSF
jgi:hypothetical protein